MSNPNPPAQAGDEPMREAPKLTKDMIEAIRSISGAPDVDGIPQPYAGAIVLLETFASIGMTATRNGQPTPNSLLCTKFANDLREAAQVLPRATADVERDALYFAEQIVRTHINLDLWMRKDHACNECVPGQNGVKEGFQCFYHRAKSFIATTKPGA